MNVTAKIFENRVVDGAMVGLGFLLRAVFQLYVAYQSHKPNQHHIDHHMVAHS